MQSRLQVAYTDEGGRECVRIFSQSLRIGRSPECDIQIHDGVVSRKHVEILSLAGSWWVIDEASANGTFINEVKIDRFQLTGDCSIELGKGGPIISVHIDQPEKKKEEKEDPLSLTQYQKRYFSEEGDHDAGEHTMMVRRAFKRVQKKQKRTFGGIIAVSLCLLVVVGTVAVYKHFQVVKQRELAGEIFYAMKGLELELAELLASARESKDKETLAKVDTFEKKAEELEKSYSEFVERLEIYEKKISEEQQIILKLARTFGECEIFMPDEFADEVLRYVEKWKSTNRFSNAISRAEKNGYVIPIAGTMLSQDLPPQFLYLAMQESNFDVNACGPKTRWGIAKGMWQFIPSTAKYYGLQTGPLSDYRKPDPNDDRHHFIKSTKAAAKYLRHIYDTDAQASGLLVMASYNWGENRVNRLLNEMPENPKERNFWQFLKKYKDKMPKQTYDYVFYIFSAAVIGENPELFGFDMENPLAQVES